MTNIANFLLYQVGWFACVLGLAWDLQWLGASFALGLLLTHFWFAADRTIQIQLCLLAAACGLVVNSVQLRAGVFAFPRGAIVNYVPPPCMTVLWMQFATTFRYSMRWLSERYVLSGLFGLFGAPLAFFAGERLGAIEFLSPRLIHFFILGLLWSVAVPLLIYFADRLAVRNPNPSQYNWAASKG